MGEDIIAFEKIFGPLKEAKDFTKLVDYEFSQVLQKEGVIRALYNSGDKSPEIAIFLRGLSNIAIMLQALAE